MPLTEVVEFKTSLQQGNRIQVPRLIRWQFKLEPDQVLKIGISPLGLIIEWETFYGQMNKDGRITIPYLIRKLLRSKRSDHQTLEGVVLQVRIEPAEGAKRYH